jgi:4-amino-4-deoxy-L-arabinose transferase-like glycosyltransferase
MGAAFLAGCLIAGSIGVSLLLAACALVASWPAPDSRGERVAEIALAATAIGVTLVQTLGFAGQLRVGVVVAAAVGCGALSSAMTRAARDRARLLALDLRAGVAAVKASLPLTAAAVLGGLLACRGLSLPELSWDGLTYHLTYPAFWLQTASFGRFEAGGVWEQYESFPKGGEALFFLAMLPFHADYFVHWVNLPLWIGIGIAVRAAASRVGCSTRAADVCAAIAIGCPALSAYVTPSYVEVPMTFALSVALAAALRALIARDAGALAPMWLALGLAISIKVTALAYLPIGLLVTLVAMDALTPRVCLRATAWGVLLASAVALPWYVHNVVQCDNPLYPAGLPGASDGPAAGTLKNVWAVRESSVLSQAAVTDVLDHLAKAPWRMRYPLGPGWLFLGALPASIVLSLYVLLRVRRASRSAGHMPALGGTARASALFAAFAFALTVLYAISPWNGVFREANTRFLMPAVIAAILSLAASSAELPRWVGQTLSGLGGASVLTALGTTRFVRDGVSDYRAALAVGLLVATGLTLLHAARVERERRWRWVATSVMMLALSCAGLALAVNAREQRRLGAYVHAVDLHPIARFPELWRFVETLPPSRIAFSVGDINETEGWFFYPLFGSRLQHAVRYVDIEEVDSPACVRRGLIRDEPSAAAWRNRLREQRVEYLAIAGHSVELSWAQAAPELFRPVFKASNTVVYQIDPQVLLGQ